MAVESQTGVTGSTTSINSWSAEYLDAMYEQYRVDPDSVPEDARAFFQGFDLALAKEGDAALKAGPGAGGASPFQSAVDELINTFRESGHLCAQIDPFDRARPRPKQLELSHYGLTDKDLDRRVEAVLREGGTSGTLREIIAHLEQTYCRSIGLEFMHNNKLQTVS